MWFDYLRAIQKNENKLNLCDGGRGRWMGRGPKDSGDADRDRAELESQTQSEAGWGTALLSTGRSDECSMAGRTGRRGSGIATSVKRNLKDKKVNKCLQCDKTVGTRAKVYFFRPPPVAWSPPPSSNI